MERKRNRATYTAVIVLTAITIGLASACADSLTDASPVPVSMNTSSVGTSLTVPSAENPEDEPPGTLALPPADDPAADPQDPVAVASALVTILTNRRPDLPDAAWRDLWARWVTPSLGSQLDEKRTNGVYDDQVRSRGSQPVGAVVGSAKRDVSVQRCEVVVIVDQTLLTDGKPIDERNFVSWKLDVERSDDSRWRVSGISLGGTP